MSSRWIDFGRWHSRQARHRHDLARDDDDELGAGRQPQLADRHDVTRRRAALRRVGRERILRLRHATGKMAEARGFEIPELGFDGGIARDICGAVDFLCDRLHFVTQLHVVGIERLEVRLTLIDDLDDVVGERSVPLPPSDQCVHRNAFVPMLSAAFWTSATSASVSVMNLLTATTAGTPNLLTFSMWRFRLSQPLATAAAFSASDHPWRHRRASSERGPSRR